MRRLGHPADLTALVGTELGVSRWRTVDQDAVDRFAALTGDRQWLHVDPERAATGPFGRPVAHGFLVISLVPAMLDEVIEVAGVDHTLNKGVDRIRIVAPVPVGSRVRARFDLPSARVRPRGYVEAVFEASVQVEGVADPVLRVAVTYLYRVAEAAGPAKPLPLR
ncbi:MaoC family dehydratase [Micromonospora sp. WMMA1923]|uniref:MaoC family dehydratase n=1 Tax=Micromonospora sp. WMMA1923 TaxID=3404125 RepID=UPI003B941383